MDPSFKIDNPLFEAYGRLVDQLLVAQANNETILSILPHGSGSPRGSEAVGESPPSVGQDKSQVTASGPGEADTGSVDLSQHFSAAQLKSFQEILSAFKDGLEGGEKIAAATNKKWLPVLQRQFPAFHNVSGEKTLQQLLREFRAARETGNESTLAGNPFYLLAKQLFREHLAGSMRFFATCQASHISHPPREARPWRPLKEIWLGPRRARTRAKRIRESFSKWIILSKCSLGWLLFWASALTTTWWLNDLFQVEDLSRLMGGSLAGSEGEIARYLASFTGGVLLSWAIIDFKGRVFQEVAEAGRVAEGVGNAFRRYPRWLTFSGLLLCFSLLTNYDGVVSIATKRGDLARQSEAIHSQVERALGSWFTEDTDALDSLHDLHAEIQASTHDAIQAFLSIPEEEQKGHATSSNARKGPRYWGKYYIVHGEYEPGVRDVVGAYRKTASAREIDAILRGSDLDLTLSISSKIAAIEREYKARLEKTDRQVRSHLKELSALLKPREATFIEFFRVLTLEHYQINGIVGNIVDALEADKVAYGQIVESVRKLIREYVALLEKVDKLGSDRSSDYEIGIKLSVPRIDAIDELRKEFIPWAYHKNIEELKDFLTREDGFLMAALQLAVIFFLAIALDLGDWLVHARRVAQRGLRERSALPGLLKELAEWEAAFIREGAHFFQQLKQDGVLDGIDFPSEAGLGNALFQLLEEISPGVREADQRSWTERMEWKLDGYIEGTRILEIRCYRARAAAIRLFVQRRKELFPSYLEKALPGLWLMENPEEEPFVVLYQHVRQGQLQNQETFNRELEALRHSDSGDSDRGSFWRGAADSQSIQSGACARTRRNWLAGLARRTLIPDGGVEEVVAFAPRLKEAMGETLPEIKKTLLDPLSDIQVRLAAFGDQRGGMDLFSLVTRFEEIEKHALEMLSLSNLGENGIALYHIGPTLAILNCDLDIEQMVREVRESQKAGSGYFRRIDDLKAALTSALENARQLETEAREEMQKAFGQIKGRWEAIRQRLLKINRLAWGLRDQANPPRQPLLLLQSKRALLEKTPQEAETILFRSSQLLEEETPPSDKSLSSLGKLNNAIGQRLKAVVEIESALNRFVVEKNPPPTPGNGGEEVDRNQMLASDSSPLAKTGHIPQTVEQSPGQEMKKTALTVQKPPATKQKEGVGSNPSERPSAEGVSSSEGGLDSAEKAGEKRIQVEFLPQQGTTIQGPARKITSQGVHFAPSGCVAAIRPGERGQLRLVSPEGIHQFPCLVKNINQEGVWLELLSVEGRFEGVRPGGEKG
ncbi:MAG: hypothetical protein HQL52_15350 [Magnetococcales bacterium]|nr:hypothetical protein [Magnetococcales bacterium]